MNNNNDLTISISSTDLNSEPSSIDTEKIYSFNEKKIMVSQIEQLKNKKIYLKIFDIISKDDNNYTINSNGVFFNFNLLKNTTLSKIECLLNNYNMIKKEKLMSSKWKNILDNHCINDNNM